MEQAALTGRLQLLAPPEPPPEREAPLETLDLSSETSEDLAQALDRARAGVEQGFVVLYRHLHPRLERYLRGLVGSEAEDIAAEAWYQVARDLRSFSGDIDGFRGWVATIARHRALDHLRARARRPYVLDEQPGLVRAASDDTARCAIDRIGSAEAIALIANLPQEMAEAVLLRTVVGLDAASAGKVLGKSAGAVRVAAHRGLKRLAEHLSEEARDVP